MSTTAPRCPGCGAPGTAAGAGEISAADPHRAVTASLGIRTSEVSAAKRPNISRTRIGAAIAAFVLAVWIVLKWAHGPSAERYYPLKLGFTWTYRVSTTVLSLPISGQMKVTNLASRNLNGRTVVPQTTDASLGPMLGTVFPKQLSVSFYLDDGSGLLEISNQEDADTEPKPVGNYELKYPIRVGTRWTSQLKTLLLGKDISISAESTLVSTTDQVVVPAGSYSNCIRITTVGKTAVDSSGSFVSTDDNEWLAPDVGMVKEIYTEKKNNSSEKASMVAELEDFKR